MNLPKIKRITIVGLGLIGGSIGLALKPVISGNTELIGYTRSAETAAKALKRKAIDRIEDNLTSAVDKTNLVILATPPMVIREILQQIGPCLSPDCIVTDIASTKVEVMKWAGEFLPQTIDFVGGHPMAGKETSGIDVAEASLFQNCTYCLVPEENASSKATEIMIDLVHTLGAKPVILRADEHDKLVAGISHLPLIISSALVLATTQSPLWNQMSGLAAGGYRDLTRLASQHPEMNRDICLTNRQNILDWIDAFIKEINRFRELVDSSDAKLEKVFNQGKQYRQKWIEERAKRD